jgi:competence protein ComEA
VKAGRFINSWTVTAILLAVIIVAGGTVIWAKHSRSQPIEIFMASDREIQGRISVGGEVNNPGFYPLKAGDGIEDVLRVAGGITDNADLNRVELVVPGKEEGDTPQKVNINTAEAWLLAALPGIGEVRAQAIIDYRQQHGPFRDVNELLQVDGFGDITYERIRHLITVAD